MLRFNTHNGFDSFESQPGVHRVLSLMPPKPKAMQRFGDAFGVIDRKDWVETDRHSALSERMPRYNQMSIGNCELHSEVECLGGLRAIAGLPPVALSAPMLYALVGDGADNGASIGDGYPYLLKFGVCKLETMVENRLYTRAEITQAAYDEARRFRAIRAYHCPTFGEIVTATMGGCWVAHGVVVGDGFNNPDRDGICPQDHNKPPNHAVSAWDVRRRKNGEWYLWDLNHWTRQWGDDGDFGTTEEQYESQLYQDAIAYEVITIDAETGAGVPVAI